MANRAMDWLRQAEHDLAVARSNAQNNHNDWACFASQQAAEKALKALYQHHNSEGWGHSLDSLINGLVELEPGLAEFGEAGKALDKCYIPTRYPNGLPAGAPADAYTSSEAHKAISDAQDIITFCQTRCRA